MPKSNRGSVFGRGFGGTVTVIEEPVLRSAARKAKIVFWIVWVASGLLAASVLASKWHPVLALFAGAFVGLVLAAVTASIVAAWPVIRAIWWWVPELGLTASLFIGWIELAAHTGLVLRLIAVTLIVGVPAAITPVRRAICALAWCLISRHRIRTCFNEFIITNRTGSLPLILGARPTPAGERLWIWLRPGLSLADIQDRLEKIAAACWASAVLADLAKPSNSALIRIDIKRRDPLTGTVSSPLTTVLSGAIPRRKQDTATLPAALDLPDVSAAEVTTPAKGGPAPWPQAQPRLPKSPVTGNGHADTEDLSDWL